MANRSPALSVLSEQLNHITGAPDSLLFFQLLSIIVTPTEKLENYEKLCFTFDKPCATIYRLAECHSPGAQFADHTDRILSPWAEIIERW
jgi:hypothetical protein